MIRICCSKFHKGDPIFGEKPPYENKDYTHGFCPSCFELEMEELERGGHIGSDWREEWREFKKNKGRRNMPREKQPKKGDFVLFEDDYFIITKVRGRMVNLEGVCGGDVYENLLIDNLAPTDIQTWEAE
jgi:hypothetical protein